MKTVQILGTAPNLAETPTVDGAERWGGNHHRSYYKVLPEVLDTYTRWFNLHSMNHIKARYKKREHIWYATQTKPIYLQEPHPDVPSSVRFPKERLQQHFSIDGTPFRYFSCSVAWYIAFAIFEGFERIELWGFELTMSWKYAYERPCFFYWIDRARSSGIDVYLPPNVLITDAGDPLSYTGHLYGYEPHNAYYAKHF